MTNKYCGKCTGRLVAEDQFINTERTINAKPRWPTSRCQPQHKLDNMIPPEESSASPPTTTSLQA